MKKTTMGLALALTCLAGAAWAGETPAAKAQPTQPPVVEAPAPADVVAPVEAEGLEVEGTCENADLSSAAPSVAGDLVDAADQAAACRPCKGRTWCKCTYNGQPRSSCDPCCYTNDIGVTVCLD